MTTNQDSRLLGNLPPRIDREEIKRFIESLPRITEDEINSLEDKEAACPICMTSFQALLAEEELAEAMDSPARPPGSVGVTKLSESWHCGHMFCRRDLSQWANIGYRTCPLCRGPLYEPSAQDTASPPPAPTLPLPESILSVINFLNLTSRGGSNNVNSGSSSSTAGASSSSGTGGSSSASRNAAATSQRSEEGNNMLEALLRLEQLQRQAEEFASFVPAIDTNRRRRTQDPHNRTLYYDYESDNPGSGGGSSGMYS